MTDGALENPNNETPLESWKEIAAYLQRDVSTAMRWEKCEGLPVRRHHHQARSSVYAYPSELDAWRVNRIPSAEAPHSPWWRLVPAFASTMVVALALMTVGSGANIGALVQAAGGSAIVTRQVWLQAHGSFTGAPSPDGRYMTFTDWETGNLGLRDLQAETQRPLTSEGTWEDPVQFAVNSRWSADSRQVVYTWQRGLAVELRTLALEDPKPRILFRDDSVDWVGPLDWSPDGEHILAGIDRKGGGGQLALISVADGSARVLTGVEHGAASFSPDGRYIVYDALPRDKSAGRDLFIVAAGGGQPVPLVEHPADDSLLGWAPGGNWVLFASDRAGSRDFWVIQAVEGRPQGTARRIKQSLGRVAPLGFARDGSFYYADVKATRDIYTARVDLQTGKVLAAPEKAIQRFEGFNLNPRYSPDGKSLAYVSRRGNMVFPTNRGNALCIHGLESGRERVFYEEIRALGLGHIAGPRWAPDSRSMLLAGWYPRGIYHANLDTGQVKPVLQLPADVNILNHEWSRDGQSFFYVRQNRENNLCQILSRSLKTGEERELYRAPKADRLAIAVSPDGRRLAFLNYPERVLYLLPAGGGPAREICRLGQRDRVTTPEWTTDGKSVLVGRSRAGELTAGVLLRVPTDGGSPQELGLHARFSDRVSLHPDGQRIAYCVTSEFDSAADVWVMQNFLPGSEVAAK